MDGVVVVVVVLNDFKSFFFCVHLNMFVEIFKSEITINHFSLSHLSKYAFMIAFFVVSKSFVVVETTVSLFASCVSIQLSGRLAFISSVI